MTAIMLGQNSAMLNRAGEIGLQSRDYASSDIALFPASASATCSIQFKTNGDLTVVADTGTPGADEWHVSNPLAGLGDDWWVKYTVVSGALDIGTGGTWQRLTSPRTFGVTASRSGFGSDNSAVTGNVSFSLDGGATTLVLIGDVNMSATATVDV